MALTAGSWCRPFSSLGVASLFIDFFVAADAICMHCIFKHFNVFFVFLVLGKQVMAFSTFLHAVAVFEVQGLVILVMMTIATGKFIICKMFSVAEFNKFIFGGFFLSFLIFVEIHCYCVRRLGSCIKARNSKNYRNPCSQKQSKQFFVHLSSLLS